MPFVAPVVFDSESAELADEGGYKANCNGAAYSVCKSLPCDTCGHSVLILA